MPLTDIQHTLPPPREQATLPVRPRQAIRITTSTPLGMQEECRVVVEQPITITIDGVGAYTLMCTPTDTAALAIGFAFSEGLIADLRAIDLLYHCEDDPAVRLRLNTQPQAQTERNLVVSSSCGLCGTLNIDVLLQSLPSVGQHLAVPSRTIHQVQAAMRQRQALFACTGGTHAAAIFSAAGDILACAEDLGRHNALDKCLGLCLLQELSMLGCGVMLSGRVSLELVVKAARAGIELIAAVSAPSSLAIDAAEQCGITLCGFVREDRLTVYTHPARLLETKSA